jgi:predicted AAA+ superfamily ATPase
MLPVEIATLLAGKYVEMQMLPLSFKKYFSSERQKKKECFDGYVQFASFSYTVNTSDKEALDEKDNHRNIL